MPITTCNICHRSFNRAYNLRRHMEIHQREPIEPQDPFSTCGICGKVTATHDLNRHLKLCHSPWTGPICEDTKTVHKPGRHFKPKQCPECGLFFLYLRSFIIHLQTHGLAHSQIKAIINVSHIFLLTLSASLINSEFYLFRLYINKSKWEIKNHYQPSTCLQITMMKAMLTKHTQTQHATKKEQLAIVKRQDHQLKVLLLNVRDLMLKTS